MVSHIADLVFLLQLICLGFGMEESGMHFLSHGEPRHPGSPALRSDEVRDEGDGRGAAPDVSINIHSKPFFF